MVRDTLQCLRPVLLPFVAGAAPAAKRCELPFGNAPGPLAAVSDPPGVNIGPLMASVGGLGVAVGLATQNLASNFVAALALVRAGGASPAGTMCLCSLPALLHGSLLPCSASQHAPSLAPASRSTPAALLWLGTACSCWPAGRPCWRQGAARAAARASFAVHCMLHRSLRLSIPRQPVQGCPRSAAPLCRGWWPRLSRCAL